MEFNSNLNATQKSLLDAYFGGNFGVISLLKDDDIEPRVSLVALKALRDLCNGSKDLYTQNVSLFKSHEILPSVDQIIEIINHPAPPE